MTLPNLDRLHAAATPGPWFSDANRPKRDLPRKTPGGGFAVDGADADLIVALRNSYPALREYVRALEAERDARSIVDREGATNGCCDECTEHMKRLKAARLATDAAREKMEKQDG